MIGARQLLLLVVALVLAVEIARIADQNRSITDVAQGGPARRQPFVNHAALRSGHGRDANFRQALRELLDNPERDDWDELVAANRAL